MAYLYMLAALVAWTMLALIYRRAERSGANRFVMASALGAGSIVLTLTAGLLSGANFRAAHVSQIMIGGLSGLLIATALPCFLAALARGSIGTSWVALTLSFALASACSLIFPGERPSILGIAGLFTAILAVVFLGLDSVGRKMDGSGMQYRKGWFLFIALAFLANGFALYCFTLATHFAPDKTAAQRMVFLLSSYSTLVVGSLFMALIAGGNGRRTAAVGHGVLAGVASFVGSYTMLLAMQQGSVPSYLVFPITHGGSNVLVVLLSVLFLGERPGRSGWCGIFAGIAALVMLTITA